MERGVLEDRHSVDWGRIRLAVSPKTTPAHNESSVEDSVQSTGSAAHIIGEDYLPQTSLTSTRELSSTRNW